MMKKARDVSPGDRTGEWMVIESRPYSPNPEKMWLIFWQKRTEFLSDTHDAPNYRRSDESFVPHDMLIEIAHEAYEIVELP